MTGHDIATRRARDLERYHRRVAERRARGLCLKCGKRPPAPHRSQCEPCIAKRRPADSRALPPAHRRACRPGAVPEVREAAARDRPDPVRGVQ